MSTPRAGFIARHRVRIASSVVLTLAASALVVYAVTQRGNPARDAHLNDAGVWISTNDTTSQQGTLGMFGEINVPAQEFAATLLPTGKPAELDVVQHGNAVAGIDQTSGSLIPINTAEQRLGSNRVKLGQAVAVMGGDDRDGTLAVLDRNGGIWAMTFKPDDQLGDASAVTPDGKAPVKVGARSALAVADNGTVFAVSPSKGLTEITQENGTWKGHSSPLPDDIDGDLSVTTVGDKPVVLAKKGANAVLVLPGGNKVSLPQAPDAVLQQSGPSADSVLVATSTALMSVPLSGGSARSLISSSGFPTAPVVFQGCQFGAWSAGRSTEARFCGDNDGVVQELKSNGSPLNGLIFRVNHQHLLLNDRSTGLAWDMTSGEPLNVADWKAVQAPTKSTTHGGGDGNTNSKAPIAKDDPNLGARPGRITVLHVLDNDRTSPGTVLTVNSATPASDARVHTSIAPDRQSVLVDIEPDVLGTFSFSYDVSNGSAKISKPAKVTVHVVPVGTYAAPNLRQGFQPHPWSVPVNGTLRIPVLDDWRVDLTGDAPALQALKPTDVSRPEATAITTSDGSILYRAGNDSGTDTISYTVVDGDRTSTGKIAVNIQKHGATGVAPIAADDYVRVVVGQPRTFAPLGNDLPGSDPQTADPVLRIANAIKSQDAALTVRPPSADGSVVISASAAGTYTLHYQDSYNAAPLSQLATIRVEAVDAEAHQRVVAGPDAVTVRGQAATLLDPLVNDTSPTGGLLTVTNALASDTSNLQVAVVNGRWLRVNQRESVDSPQSETVSYTITDGATSATGQVTVSELQALDSDVPVAVTDYADVRIGDSATIAPLDNDVDPSGASMSLAQEQAEGYAAGELPVSAAPGIPAEALGRAFVSGNLVRYVPPSTSKQTGQYRVFIKYTVENASGQQRGGRIVVKLWPVGTAKTDLAPAPVDLEARVVAGGTVVIHVPTSGVDPDGDSVQVEGLALPANGDPQPHNGAVIAHTANSLSYQAFPSATNAGTDEFSYQVIDTYGAVGQGTIRVAVVQPTVLPAPVAHNVVLKAAPGTNLMLHVVTPKFVDFPEGAAPTLLDPRKLDQSSRGSLVKNSPGWLKVRIPRHALGNVIDVNYQVQPDLGRASGGTIRFELVPGYQAPPIVVDQFAHLKARAATVTVPLLKGAYSPSGALPLKVEPMAGLVGKTLLVKLTDYPQVVPYVVSDAAGAKASAVVYVPARGISSIPYWNGTRILLREGKTSRVDIGKYVTDPEGKSLSLTTIDQIWSSPTSAIDDASIKGATTIQVATHPGFQGPASLTFAVTRTRKLNDFSLITVPVIIGDPAPVLRCPTDVVDVQQGLDGGAALSPLSQCHVWVPPRVNSAELTFGLKWKKQPRLVEISTNHKARVFINASRDAHPGDLGAVTVSVDRFPHAATATMQVRVVKADALQVFPIPAQTILTNGAPRVIHLKGKVDSPFGFDAVSIVSLGTIKGADITMDKTRHDIIVTIKDPGLSGTFKVPFVVTDLSDLNNKSRQKSGAISMQIIGIPDAPTGVAPRPGYKSGVVTLDWTPPNGNGSPPTLNNVEYRAAGESGHQVCLSKDNPCDITGLVNGLDYEFRIQSMNDVTKEYGHFSDWSNSKGTPDEPPGQVQNFNAAIPVPAQEDTLLLTWDKPAGAGSTNGLKYTITGTQGFSTISDLPGTATSKLVTTPTNEVPIEFSIVATNRAGDSTSIPATKTAQSAGTPRTPKFDSARFTPTKTAAGEAAVTLSWAENPPVTPNGPRANGLFVLTRTDADGVSNFKSVCEVDGTQCTDDHLNAGGQIYVYTLVAHNSVYTSGEAKTPVDVSTPPEVMAAPTVDPVVASTNDGTATIHFRTVESNGHTSVTVHCAFATGGASPTKTSSPCSGQPYAEPGEDNPDTKTVTNIPNGASVRFIVWEDNGSTNPNFAEGPASPASNAVVTNAPPTAPTGPVCGLNGTTVRFTWSAGTTSGGRGIHYSLTGAVNDSNYGGTFVDVGYPADGGSSTLFVTSVDSKGESSGALQVGPCAHAPKPQPTQWTVTVNTATCPETTFVNGSSHFHKGPPPTCSGPYNKFIPVGTVFTVDQCSSHSGWPGGVTNINWYHIIGAGDPVYVGWWVYSGNVSGDTTGIPGC